MTRRATGWLASNGVCRSTISWWIFFGRGTFGWRPSVRGRRRSVCRRSTDKAKILLLGARTQNGGFDMIRYAFYAYALLLARRQARRTTAEIPDVSSVLRGGAGLLDELAWLGLLGERAASFGTHINKKITQKKKTVLGENRWMGWMAF
ncbi:hypothetical protein CCUS01_00154 [Colletotrichum cuscutae]|uniref:Uncharacterized protein n=1 Tax=Colletotrichum cuscutae TaxID=1209917 RepID=A0AAI9YDU5_9PEZI|nr:hypothetical protein CCUS01_00154 [Colletotrichum cuscutae]